MKENHQLEMQMNFTLSIVTAVARSLSFTLQQVNCGKVRDSSTSPGAAK